MCSSDLERLELLLRVDAVAVGIEALHRHGSIELVERPGVTNAGDPMIGPEQDLRADRGPDMRMGRGSPREAGRDYGCEKNNEKTLAPHWIPQRPGLSSFGSELVLGANYGGLGAEC